MQDFVATFSLCRFLVTSRTYAYQRQDWKLDGFAQVGLMPFIIRHNTLPAIERALAGRSLAALGDPRPEVTSLDGMHFCLVPPGPFVMGSDDVDDEKPQHIVDVAYPYFIGRFPVTVAQWREYMELSGAAAEDEDSLHGRDNDPVTNVSWLLRCRRNARWFTQPCTLASSARASAC